jgi:hypothetical protein
MQSPLLARLLVLIVVILLVIGLVLTSMPGPVPA